MRLTIVGCAGSFPRPDSACSAYLIEADGFRLVLDMGNGALGALQRHIDMYDFDALLVTHLHGDHCFDACTYVVARRYTDKAPLPTVPLYAPTGALDRFSRAYETNGDEADLHDVYDEHVLTPGRLEIGPFQVTVDRMNHPVETYGVRLEQGGRTFAYSADSGRSDRLVALARDADLFLCEASYNAGRENPPDLHLTGAEAGEHAARAGTGRLLLTHLTSWSEPERTLTEAKGTYDGDVSIVAAGDSHDV